MNMLNGGLLCSRHAVLEVEHEGIGSDARGAFEHTLARRGDEEPAPGHRTSAGAD